MPKLLCIGVPHWLGLIEPGRNAVQRVRESGFAQELGALWVDLNPPADSDIRPVVAVNRALAAVITSYPDHIPLIFASDCTSCWGAMKGLSSHTPHVLWYDAHGDFNTPQTTPSGFLGGMPLAALTGRGNQDYLAEIALDPVSEARVTITDARNLDPEEGEMLANSQVHHLRDVTLLHAVNWSGQPLYLHFDTDIADPQEMPALSYPEAGGPSLALLGDTLEHVARSARVVGALFTLWDDRLAGGDRALTATLQLARRLVAGLQ